MLPYPFDRNKTFFFGYGRVALLEGLKSLKVKEGDNVLIPSYICNSVLSPFNYLGIEVRYYDADENLHPLMADIKRQTDENTKAILAVNYFGLPKGVDEVIEICRNSKIYFIEDNAHGFLSKNGDRALGTFGDIAIFSFRKTLLLPNGGALMINNPNLPVPETEYNRYGGLQDLKYLRRSILNLLAKYLKIDARKIMNTISPEAIAKRLSPPSPPEEEININEYFVKLSFISRFALEHLSTDKIISLRRYNYRKLLSFFNSNKEWGKPLLQNLSGGIVPYAFPILVDDPLLFIKEMLKRGYRCWPWPGLPQAIKNRKDLPRFYTNTVLIPLDKEIYL